ncbi:MAG TPA: nitroreductase family protein, partial [Pirellulales bacterium]|nr:nitroreductase family protein [Pirellulales bacterium]
MSPAEAIKADHPINELIANRWSPYAFSDSPVSADDLRSLFEAARWAPSSYNEQPWCYLVATKDNAAEFERVLSCLVPGNQAWAKAAPVLALGCTRLTFARNATPNACALHDLGLASSNICLEATARGICVHQMVGILPERAREIFQIPADAQALTGLAIGYPADPSVLPAELGQRDRARRGRKPIGEFLFTGKWQAT